MSWDLPAISCWGMYCTRLRSIGRRVGGSTSAVLWPFFSHLSERSLFYENFTVNTLLESAAIFLLFKNRIGSETTASASDGNSISERIILFLSGCSFGIYLIHPAWIYVLDHYFGITTSSASAWISVPLLTIVCLLLSLTLTAILRFIPVIKRYLV